MRLPFHELSSARLDDIVRPGLLCTFDVDGPLSPSVAQPEKAQPPFGVLQRLTVFANLAPSDAITGRPAVDMRDIFAVFDVVARRLCQAGAGNWIRAAVGHVPPYGGRL